ncbi:MAG TPA: hypothetical protein VGN72_20840 [Tepidisphaeraceae bacterium]|nr:hypothetical protein [Tepidisphaeraceae bacterium]
MTIVLMIALDAAHPLAVSTALAFAFRAGDESSVGLFGVAVAITALTRGPAAGGDVDAVAARPPTSRGARDALARPTLTPKWVSHGVQSRRGC